MKWYWIILTVAFVLILALLGAGYALFLYLCKQNRKQASSLEGSEGRSLHKYVPVIKQKAKEIAAIPHELVSIRSFDGLTLRAKLYPNTKTDRVVILIHGYHSSPSWDFGASFGMYYKAGYTILALEDRAHGSDGEYIGLGATDQKDVHGWMDWTVNRFGKGVKIALIGISMGAATAMLVSGNEAVPQLACVVEDCGYSSIWGMGKHLMGQKHVPTFPLLNIASMWSGVFAGYRFAEADPKAAVQKSYVPTLFIHGSADNFVPFPMLDVVYHACAAPKEKAVFEDAVHGESSYKYPERYEQTVLPFLAKYMEA